VEDAPCAIDRCWRHSLPQVVLMINQGSTLWQS
jgi:hypothetical protein